MLALMDNSSKCPDHLFSGQLIPCPLIEAENDISHKILTRDET